SGLLQFWILIANSLEIGGARSRVQFAKECVIPLLRFQFGYAAVLVIGIAEDYGFSRAGLFARRHDRAIVNRRVQLFRFDARVVDALHTIGALLHNAAAAHGDFRIAQKFELRRLPILEAQEVEAANFVGAVVRTVARADAAIVVR